MGYGSILARSAGKIKKERITIEEEKFTDAACVLETIQAELECATVIARTIAECLRREELSNEGYGTAVLGLSSYLKRLTDELGDTYKIIQQKIQADSKQKREALA